MFESTPEELLLGEESRTDELSRYVNADERAATLVALALREVSGDALWRRHLVLDRLRLLPDVAALLPALGAALADGADAERRNSARSVLAALADAGAADSERAVEFLASSATQHSEADVRLIAASALGESCNRAGREPLEAALGDADSNVIAAAADALGALRDPAAAPGLARVATGAGDLWVRIAATSAMGQLGDSRAVDALAGLSREPWLSVVAAIALGQILDPSSLHALRTFVSQDEETARAALDSAAGVLAAHPDLEAPAWLRAAAVAREDELIERMARPEQESAARLLGVAGTPRAVDALLSALSDRQHRAPALVGIGALPADVSTAAILERLGSADVEERTALLGILPPLSAPEPAERVAAELAADDGELRSAAAEALRRSSPEVVLPALDRRMGDPSSRLGVAQTLGRMPGVRCERLVELLGDDDPRVRAAAARGVGHCGPGYSEAVRDALARETDDRARCALVRALGVIGGDLAVQEISRYLQAEEPTLRFSAVQALGETRSESALPDLLGVLSDPSSHMQAAALRALGELGDPRAVDPVALHVRDADRDLRRTAASALDRLASREAVDRLIAALDDEDHEVRITAVRTLQRLNARAATAELSQVADGDPSPLVREAANRAVVALGGGAVSSERG